MLLDKISKLCKERGISIARLERDCSLGNATVRGWATSSPTVDKLKAVADYLDTTMDDLLREDEDQEATYD